MGLSSSDLDRLADDIYKDRRLTASTYCGHCGYNLRTLPYVYTCPECGSPYNARPLKMTGIFLPQQRIFPFDDLASALVLTAAASFLIVRAVRDPAGGLVIPAGVMAALALAYLYRSTKCLARFFRLFGVARRIAREESDRGERQDFE